MRQVQIQRTAARAAAARRRRDEAELDELPTEAAADTSDADDTLAAIDEALSDEADPC
jgi:hypothetical protein